MTVGTPCVVLAQNAREMTHLHARAVYGVINLGLGQSVSQNTLGATLDNLIETPKLRQEMNTQMMALDIRRGCTRMLDSILYRTFEGEQTI